MEVAYNAPNMVDVGVQCCESAPAGERAGQDHSAGAVCVCFRSVFQVEGSRVTASERQIYTFLGGEGKCGTGAASGGRSVVVVEDGGVEEFVSYRAVSRLYVVVYAHVAPQVHVFCIFYDKLYVCMHWRHT